MEDLSGKLSWENGLNAGESMAGGNTTAYDPDNNAMKGPGSVSVYPRPESTDDPDLELAPVKTPNTLMGQNTKTDGSWTKFGKVNGFGRGE
jgi:hypothetical protein